MATGEMGACVLHRPRQLTWQAWPRPQPGPGEVLVRVEHAGVCGSDLHAFAGDRAPARYPMVMGHEAVGRVVGLGPGVPARRLGQRVVIEPNIPCGRCRWCRDGQANICPSKRVLGFTEPGVWAEYVAVPAEFAWTVPEETGWQELLLVEPTAVALHALGLARLLPGERAVVVGCGSEGLLLTALAALWQLEVVALDRLASRVTAAQRLGARRALQVDGRFPETLARELASDGPRTVIFEASGTALGARWSVELAPRGALVIWLGLATEAVPLVPLRLVREGISLTGSLIYDHPTDFARAVDLAASGRLSAAAGVIVERRVEAAQAAQALPAALAGEVVKLALSLYGPGTNPAREELPA